MLSRFLLIKSQELQIRNPLRAEPAFADFNGDGLDDVLWRNSENNVL